MTRRKSALDQCTARCIAVTEAYRNHALSTRQREQAAAELGLDEATFKAWLAEARQMGWLSLSE